MLIPINSSAVSDQMSDYNLDIIKYCYGYKFMIVTCDLNQRLSLINVVVHINPQCFDVNLKPESDDSALMR